MAIDVILQEDILLVIEKGIGGVHKDRTLGKTGVARCPSRACQRLVVFEELMELAVTNA